MSATSFASRSGGRDHHGPASLRRSLSPSPALRSGSAFASSSASAFAPSATSSFAPRSSALLHRSASPTRVSLAGSSVRFAVASSHDHHHQRQRQRQQQQPVKRPVAGAGDGQRRTCMCSPTTHPGSFRCSLHKGFGGQGASAAAAGASTSSRLNARRSAMTNSLVRIGAVEGEWVRRALAALIRPSSHQQRRRAAFQPRPSRLSVMSNAGVNDDLR